MKRKSVTGRRDDNDQGGIRPNQDASTVQGGMRCPILAAHFRSAVRARQRSHFESLRTILDLLGASRDVQRDECHCKAWLTRIRAKFDRLGVQAARSEGLVESGNGLPRGRGVDNAGSEPGNLLEHRAGLLASGMGWNSSGCGTTACPGSVMEIAKSVDGNGRGKERTGDTGNPPDCRGRSCRGGSSLERHGSKGSDGHERHCNNGNSNGGIWVQWWEW